MSMLNKATMSSPNPFVLGQNNSNTCSSRGFETNIASTMCPNSPTHNLEAVHRNQSFRTLLRVLRKYLSMKAYNNQLVQGLNIKIIFRLFFTIIFSNPTRKLLKDLTVSKSQICIHQCKNCTWRLNEYLCKIENS